MLRQVAAEFAAERPGLRLRWVDIEDEADLLGEVDIETFPTLLLLDAQGVRFFGPLTPQPETLRRLLRAALAETAPLPPVPPVPPEVAALAAALRATTA